MPNGNPAPGPLNSRYFRPVRGKETGARRWDQEFESPLLQRRVFKLSVPRVFSAIPIQADRGKEARRLRKVTRSTRPARTSVVLAISARAMPTDGQPHLLASRPTPKIPPTMGNVISLNSSFG
jgi:hypothetical protein